MKRILIFSVSMILIGCSAVTGPEMFHPTETIQGLRNLTQTATFLATSTPTPKLRPTKTEPVPASQTPTRIPTATTIIRPFPTPLPGSQVVRKCPQLVENFSDGSKPTGVLILRKLNDFDWHKREISFFNLNTGQQMPLLVVINGQMETPRIWDVSPDRTKFVYFTTSTSGTGEQIHIRTSNGINLQVPNWDETWLGNAFWLDNTRLLIPLQNGDVVVLNTISGEWQTLALPIELEGVRSFNHPHVTYDRSLRHLLYLASSDYDQILWDVISGQEIWRREGIADPGQQAIWNTERDHFIVHSGEILGKEFRHTDFYLVDASNGTEVLLTDGLHKAFPKNEHVNPEYLPTWSTDGLYIAYSVFVDDISGQVTSPTFVVQNLQTGNIIDYCLPTFNYSIWSPDSRYVVVGIPKGTSPYGIHSNVYPHSEVYILDIATDEMILLMEDMVVTNWLKIVP